VTKLNKAVRRETAATYQGREIVIQIEPPYIVRLKEKGRRTWYTTTVNSIFNLAARQHAAAEAKRRKEEREQKRRQRNDYRHKSK